MNTTSFEVRIEGQVETINIASKRKEFEVTNATIFKVNKGTNRGMSIDE